MSVSSPMSIACLAGRDLVGDGLMKLPFVHALRQAYPDARITWIATLGGSVYKGLLAPLVKGCIDEVIENAGIYGRLAELSKPLLAGRHFDLLIDTQRRVKVSLVHRHIRHDRFISGALGGLLCQPPAFSLMRGQDRLLDRLMALLAVAVGEKVPPAEVPVALGEFMPLAASLLPGPVSRYVGFAPGAGIRKKCWPLGQFISVAKKLQERGYQPVFFLGPAEREWQETVENALPGVQLPLPEESSPLLTIALAQRCVAALANDSGCGHMLALGGTRLLTLFGPSNYRRYRPYCRNDQKVLSSETWGSKEIKAIPLEVVIGDLVDLIER